MPTPEELKLGEKACRQVRFYEKYTKPYLHLKLWIYVGSFVCLMALTLILAMGSSLGKWDFSSTLPLLFFFLAVGPLKDKTDGKRYAANKILLRELEEKYGDALPWIGDEKLLAQAEAMTGEARTQPQAGPTRERFPRPT